MARILITWELGEGLGHLTPFVGIGRRLVAAGHELYLAARDLSRVESLFGDMPIGLLQAPIKLGQRTGAINPAFTFAHVMHNTGFGDEAELAALCRAWQSIYDHVQPDLVLFEHSPTALLASQARSFRRVLIGNGFCCPADVSPLPNFRNWLPQIDRDLAQDEAYVVANMNAVSRRWRAPTLDYVAQLFRQVDATLLCTISELDAFRERSCAEGQAPPEYFGLLDESIGEDPSWPGTDGKPNLCLPKTLPCRSQSRSLARTCAWADADLRSHASCRLNTSSSTKPDTRS